MSDVMAIVSKAVFEKAAGKTPALGQRLALDRYVSANRGLTALAGGGRLFLVTVRPPDEALWLVAVLDNPTFRDGQWVAAPSATPMTDLSALKSQLVFESKKGLPTQPGTLGMSLQTPRVLTAADAQLLLGAAGAPSSPSSSAAASASAAPAAAPAPDLTAKLLAAVLAAPTADAPKLELGAHWRAQGEPRGELVELDLELRGRLSVHRRKALQQRRAALVKAHARRLWPWKLAAHRQRGGFLWAVTVETSKVAALAPALFAAEPVTELELTGADEESIAAVAKAPWLARVRSLAVRGAIGDEGFAALVKSKHLGELQALNVSSNELTAEALAELDKALPSLQRLVLTNNPIGDEGAVALTQWKHLGNLRTLYLTACELSLDGITALLGSGRLAALEKLTLAQNELGDKGAAALARHAPALPALRYLELCDISMRDAGATALAAAGWPHLRHLDVSENWCSRSKLRAAYGAALVG
ncbi:MAG: hypothetical protein IPI49_05715 [Myxococcales bacterium]|nr:hypothetical protein [Myxococcales bacterium]